MRVISSSGLSSHTLRSNVGDKRRSVGAREVKKEKKKTAVRERGGIDLFLTANQFNNSVNGETR